MTTNVNTTNLTQASFELFGQFCYDAPHWSGTPLLDITKEQRGNLVDLKKKGLVNTIRDERCDFVCFTDKGKKLAQDLGYDTTGW